MNLIDIQDCLQDHQINEVTATFESSKLMNIDWILYELSASEFHVTELCLLAAWRFWWNFWSVLDHSQKQTCESQKSFSKQLEAIQKLCQ